MIDLQVSRKQIDEIDSQIVKLFEERMKVANEVAKYKICLLYTSPSPRD